MGLSGIEERVDDQVLAPFLRSIDYAFATESKTSQPEGRRLLTTVTAEDRARTSQVRSCNMCTSLEFVSQRLQATFVLAELLRKVASLLLPEETPSYKILNNFYAVTQKVRLNPGTVRSIELHEGSLPSLVVQGSTAQELSFALVTFSGNPGRWANFSESGYHLVAGPVQGLFLFSHGSESSSRTVSYDLYLTTFNATVPEDNRYVIITCAYLDLEGANWSSIL